MQELYLYQGISYLMRVWTKQSLHKKRGTYAEGRSAADAIISRVRSRLLVISMSITLGPVGTACNPKGAKNSIGRAGAELLATLVLP